MTGMNPATGPDPHGPHSLPGRLVAFAGALREAGLPVSTSETVDAAKAMTVVPLVDRQALHAGLAATLCKRGAHREAFDRLFDLWWPTVIGEPGTLSGYQGGGEAEGTESGRAPAVAEHALADPEDVERLRLELAEVLLSGEETELRRLAAQAVARLGAAEIQPGRQSYFAYRALRALSPDTLKAQLVAALLAQRGEHEGGLAEQVARHTVSERIDRFRDLVESEVRRRLAEEKGPSAMGRTAVPALAEQVDFLRATRVELDTMRREVAPLARRLAGRLSARRRRGRNGRLDVRRTMRAAVSTGGVPLQTHHRPHRPHKPEIVLLCDVSGSVAGFAHFTLLLVMALREQFTRVRAFAFVDTCDEVTRYFVPGQDPAGALDAMVRDAQVVWFDGHSDYGRSLEAFERDNPDAVGPRTSLLILGDARNNFRATGVHVLRRLSAQARHTYWLNPEPASQWDSADSVAGVYGDVVPMVECRNVAQLADFVRRLLPA
jgi:hypothetical protein